MCGLNFMIKIEGTKANGNTISLELETPMDVVNYIAEQPAEEGDFWEFDGTPEENRQIFYMMTGEIPTEGAACAIT